MSPYLYAKFSNGRTWEQPFYETAYGVAFSILGRESCYHCRFKGNNRQGDIMVGDFWGATEKDRYWNANGVSLIFAETEKGNQFLSTLKDVTLIRCSFAEAVQNNQMVIRSRPKDPRQEEFCKMLSKKGLDVYKRQVLCSAKMVAGVKTEFSTTGAKLNNVVSTEFSSIIKPYMLKYPIGMNSTMAVAFPSFTTTRGR